MIASQATDEEGKAFFFWKKEAKNFCACALTAWRFMASACAAPNEQKFFGPFFQKRTSFLQQPAPVQETA
jgi:hypothetical protein